MLTIPRILATTALVLEEISALLSAAKKRKALKCIYVARNVVSDELMSLIPDDVVVIYDFNAQITQKIKFESTPLPFQLQA